jgi:hypothetical protein
MKITTFNRVDDLTLRIDRIKARTPEELIAKWNERMRIWTAEDIASPSGKIVGLDLAAGGSGLDFVLTVTRSSTWNDDPLAFLAPGYRDDAGTGSIGNQEEPLIHAAMADSEEDFQRSVQQLLDSVPLPADNLPEDTARTMIGPIFASQSQGNRTMVAFVSFTPQP